MSIVTPTAYESSDDIPSDIKRDIDECGKGHEYDNRCNMLEMCYLKLH